MRHDVSSVTRSYLPVPKSANKNKRLLIKENVTLDLFPIVFEEHSLKKVAYLEKLA